VGYTTNPEFFSHTRFNPSVSTQTENRVAASEAHLSRDVKPRRFASFDGNFWFGGRTECYWSRKPQCPPEEPRPRGTVSILVNRAALMAPAMIPIAAAAAGMLYGRDIWIPPATLLKQIALKLFLPLAVGMVVAWFVPKMSASASADDEWVGERPA
jgi:hypothetical protein